MDPAFRQLFHQAGVGLRREDVIRQGLPLPPADYLAETSEERLVMYVDVRDVRGAGPRGTQRFLRAPYLRWQLTEGDEAGHRSSRVWCLAEGTGGVFPGTLNDRG
jgi:hypothetical protein